MDNYDEILDRQDLDHINVRRRSAGRETLTRDAALVALRARRLRHGVVDSDYEVLTFLLELSLLDPLDTGVAAATSQMLGGQAYVVPDGTPVNPATGVPDAPEPPALNPDGSPVVGYPVAPDVPPEPETVTEPDRVPGAFSPDNGPASSSPSDGYSSRDGDR